MKKWLMGAVALILLTPALPAQNIAHRFERQNKRINQGIRAGDLTRREARGLRTAEKRLHRETARDRRDGSGLTVRERSKIDRQQDRLSRQIYRQRHDGQRRP